MNWIFTAEELNLNPGLAIRKEVVGKSADGKAYTVGETVEYRITAVNTGNVLLKDITVTDELTGDKWTIPELKPGEEKSFTTRYVVTEKDAKAGSVKNVATATAVSDNPDIPETPCVPGETEVTVKGRTGHMTLHKEALGGSGFGAGDTVNYKITVVNDGDAPLQNVRVSDELTGGRWTVERMEIGESRSFETSYRITERDAARRSVKNTAVASAENADDGTAVTAEDSCRVTVSPNTGDGADVTLWLTLLAASGCLSALLLVLYRKKKI